MLHDDVYNLKTIKKDIFNVGNSYILSIPKWVADSCVFVELKIQTCYSGKVLVVP